MSSSYNRPPSPGGRRIVQQPGRTSAGSFFGPTYYDAPASRVTRDLGSSSRAEVARAEPARAEPTRVFPVRQRSPPRRARDDDFVVRPRRMTLDPVDAVARRPLSTIVPRSPNRGPRPIVTREVERPASPSAKSSKPGVQLEASYIIPNSSSGRHHHRHSSLTTGERLRPRERDARDQAYPVDGSTRTVTARQPATRVRGEKDDRDYTYEYTGPRKEFEREIANPARPRERRETYANNRERPTSMILPDRGEVEYRRLGKDPGPPVSNRGFEAVGRSESLRQGHRSRDDGADRRDPYLRDQAREERDSTRYRDSNRAPRKPVEGEYVAYPEENQRHNRPRKPTLEDDRAETRVRPRKPEEDRYDQRPRDYDHQLDRIEEDRSRRPREKELQRDEGRRRDYDDMGSRDRRHRDESRDQRGRDDDSHSKAALAGAGVAAAGVAAVGIAAEHGRRPRPKDGRDGDPSAPQQSQGYLREPERDRAEGSETTSVSGDTRLSAEPDEDREERRRRRRRERERDERDYREAREYERRQREDPTYAVPGGDRALVPQEQRELVPSQEEGPTLQGQKSYERLPSRDLEPRPSLRRHRKRRHFNHTDDHSSYSEPSSASGVSDAEGGDVPRQPRVVTPSNEDRPAPPPKPLKGILKQAREHFPEPENHVREGVAPLDAAKRGIPADARWTRISRRLVNPEALEAEGVRFEETPDSVIVLKVLNQDEITKYTQKTHEIREKRRQMLAASSAEPGQPGPHASDYSDHS